MMRIAAFSVLLAAAISAITIGIQQPKRRTALFGFAGVLGIAAGAVVLWPDRKYRKWTERVEKKLQASTSTLTPAELLHTDFDREAARWACDHDRLVMAGESSVRLPKKPLTEDESKVMLDAHRKGSTEGSTTIRQIGGMSSEEKKPKEG